MAYEVHISELREYAEKIGKMVATDNDVADAIDRLMIGIVLTGAAIAERLENIDREP